MAKSAMVRAHGTGTKAKMECIVMFELVQILISYIKQNIPVSAFVRWLTEPYEELPHYKEIKRGYFRL